MRRFWIVLFGSWLGIGIGVSFVAIPEVFAAAGMGDVTRFQSGRMAQGILARAFNAQYILLAVAAVVHVLGARRKVPVAGTRVRTLILGAIALLVLGGGIGMQPVLRSLHRQMYDPGLTREQQDRAASRFRPLHGVSQVGNLAVLGLLLAGLWHASGAGRTDSTQGPTKRPGSLGAPESADGPGNP